MITTENEFILLRETILNNISNKDIKEAVKEALAKVSDELVALRGVIPLCKVEDEPEEIDEDGTVCHTLPMLTIREGYIKGCERGAILRCQSKEREEYPKW